MSQGHTFERALLLLQEAALDGERWPAASKALDEACATVGNSLYVSDTVGPEARIVFSGLYARGERREDLEREYLREYRPRDERRPRLWRLPDGKLVHIHDVYSAKELRTSATYNEAVRRVQGQNGLHVRLDGSQGTTILWTPHDPVGRSDWESDRIRMAQRLLPHLRQMVLIRQALARAEAAALARSEVVRSTRFGTVELDSRGRILKANDVARGILRRGDRLVDRGGELRGRWPADDERLRRLVARALPCCGCPGSGGRLLVQRLPGLMALTVHVIPVPLREIDFGARRVAVIILIVEPPDLDGIDHRQLARSLGLTRVEAQVAVALARGHRVRGIAAAMGRQESTVRWHVHKILRKQGISRQVDLVRLVLTTLRPVP